MGGRAGGRVGQPRQVVGSMLHQDLHSPFGLFFVLFTQSVATVPQAGKAVREGKGRRGEGG